MKALKDTGIILFSRPFFESDKLLEILTLNHGKLKCIAKRALKKSSGSGDLEIGCELNIVLQKGKSFFYINQSSLQPGSVVPFIRQEFNKISILFYYLTIVRQATEFDQPNTNLFKLLKYHIEQLAHETNIEKCQHTFENQFLVEEGLATSNKLDHQDFKKIYYDYTGKKPPSLQLLNNDHA